MAISTAVDASAIARVVGIKTQYKDLRGGAAPFLPQRIALVGQGSTAATYATTKRAVTSAFEVGSLYGFGSPLHLAANALMPTNGDGIGTIPLTVYPLDDAGASVAASGVITPSGTVTEGVSYIVSVNEIKSEAFSVAVGDSLDDIVAKMVTAINANVNIPIIATEGDEIVEFTSKWKGLSANDIFIRIDGSNTSGVSFAITQASGGLVNPDVQTALDQVGDIWETMMINCLNPEDETALGLYSTFGEGRWGALTKKPLVVFTGTNEASLATATSIPDSRKTDRVNSQSPLPGSEELPLVIAARQVARIAVVANNNPPMDYGSQSLASLEPGTDGEQWTYVQRDAAVKAGSSTIELRDGVPYISDTVTFYHPAGDPIPAYRYVCDIVKLQNIIFGLNLIFNSDEWNGAPLIPDDQPTVNPAAKKPKMAIAAINSFIDSLALNAIISDPVTAKANVRVEIDSSNPKRLNVYLVLQLSGNTNVVSIDLDFGFLFGTSAVIA